MPAVITLTVSEQVPHTSETVQAQTQLLWEQSASLLTEAQKLKARVDEALKQKTAGGAVRLTNGQLVIRKQR